MNFLFKNSVLATGTKTVNESENMVYLAPTFGTFRLNKRAMASMGVKEGDTVVVIDQFGNTDDQQNRFFIAKGYEEDGVVRGSKLTGAGGNQFSHAAFYATMLADDVNIQSITADALIDMGKVNPRNSEKGQPVSKFSASAKLIPYNDGQEVELTDNVSCVVYQITDIKFEPHTMKTVGVEADLTEQDFE